MMNIVEAVINKLRETNGLVCTKTWLWDRDVAVYEGFNAPSILVTFLTGLSRGDIFKEPFDPIWRQIADLVS